MTKIDPIIAVKDVNESSKWYQSVFGCKRTHGGNDFAVLVDESNEVLVCLHKWGEHEHPTMKNPKIKPGNGLILYYKTDNLEAIRQNIEKINYPVEEDIHLNPNSTKKEFSIRDNDDYYWIITEFHNYAG
jgi:catechol-2,3-dioxygenase